MLVSVASLQSVPRFIENEILGSAEVLAQTSQNEIPGNGIVSSLFLKFQEKS